MKFSFASLFLFCLLFACDTNTSSESNSYTPPQVLVPSTGGVDELMFVMNRGLLEASDTIIQKEFLEIYKLLPQPEDRFEVSTVEFVAMNNLLYRFRNTIYVTAHGANDGVFKLAQDVLGEENIQSNKALYYKRNVWAKNQLITFLIAPSIAEINNTIRQYSENIKEDISTAELKAYRDIANIDGIQEKLKKQLETYYGISIDIPANYQLAENDGSFISLRKDTEKSTIYLWFDVEEYSGPPADFDRGIEMRDARGDHVSTDLPNTYMASDSTLGFYSSRKEKEDLIIYENRGLWRMKNDFMGGPFLNQYIIDQENNRVFLLDGFVFGPGDKNKKLHMRQFEAIFSSFKKMK